MAFYRGVVSGSIDTSGTSTVPAAFCGEAMLGPGSCIATCSPFKQA
jgi:hypothetical protein